MVCDLEVFNAGDKDFDGLLLGEEAEGVTWVTFCVPPATFFWPSITLADVVDGDSCWLFVFKVEVRMPVVKGMTDSPGLWVVVTKLREIRHWRASKRIESAMEMMTMTCRMMSTSSVSTDVLAAVGLCLVIVSLPFFSVTLTHSLLLLIGKVCKCVEVVSVVVLVKCLKVSHELK